VRLIRRRRDWLSLALQGGGAHGAFTWGVLVRLLEEDLRIDGVSGTSAGALNAVVLASGWLNGGAAGAARAAADAWLRQQGRGVPSTALPERASIGPRAQHAGGRGSKRRRTA
jgi:predicted acylesterase/phospholipase RssA